jgi:hypothetical protein
MSISYLLNFKVLCVDRVTRLPRQPLIIKIRVDETTRASPGMNLARNAVKYA